MINTQHILIMPTLLITKNFVTSYMHRIHTSSVILSTLYYPSIENSEIAHKKRLEIQHVIALNRVEQHKAKDIIGSGITYHDFMCMLKKEPAGLMEAINGEEDNICGFPAQKIQFLIKAKSIDDIETSFHSENNIRAVNTVYHITVAILKISQVQKERMVQLVSIRRVIDFIYKRLEQYKDPSSEGGKCIILSNKQYMFDAWQHYKSVAHLIVAYWALVSEERYLITKNSLLKFFAVANAVEKTLLSISPDNNNKAFIEGSELWTLPEWLHVPDIALDLPPLSHQEKTALFSYRRR